MMKDTLNNIRSIIDNIHIPNHWINDVAEPNIECRHKSYNICKKIYDTLHKEPIRIATSREDGIILIYDMNTHGKTLYIEIYNDLESGYIMNDNDINKIIYNNNIDNDNFDDLMKFIDE